MNAIISAIKNRKTILIANEGRLLKKCLFGFIILFLTFQSGELGYIVRSSLVDAYIQVSVFVGFTLFVFLSLDSFSRFNIDLLLKKSKSFHVVIASIIGSLPGCGGAIIIVTQYIQGRVSFGSLVSVLTATMGDAAFLLLASQPIEGLQVFCITSCVGIVSGYAVDLIHSRNFLVNENKLKISFEEVRKTFVSKFNIIWIILFIPGFIFGVLSAFQISFDSLNFLSFNVVSILGLTGAMMSIFMWSLNPLSDFQCSTEKSRSLISRVVDTTNFVTTWVICAFLFYELFIYFTGFDLKALFNVWSGLIPLIAILLGFVPGCGPQIVVTTFYINGHIPFSAEIGNAISNDGDALFPAIALAPKAALVATLYSGIPAIIVAYGYMILFE